MPIIKSATKRARQSVKRTANNRKIKTAIKTAVKAFIAEPSQKNPSKKACSRKIPLADARLTCLKSLNKLKLKLNN